MALQSAGYGLIKTPSPRVSSLPHPITLATWLNSAWKTLPPRRIDLLGEYARPFSLQWVGSLSTLSTMLEQHGWIKLIRWTSTSALQWLAPKIDPATLPVLPRLADGRAATLVRIDSRLSAGAGPQRLVLRLWHSNIVVQDGSHAWPLWTGTVSDEKLSRRLGVLTVATSTLATIHDLETVAAVLPASREVRISNTSSHMGKALPLLLVWQASAKPLPE